MNSTAFTRGLLVLASLAITFGALALLLPPNTPQIRLPGAASVNQAPAVRIQLAGQQEPAETPEPQPESPPEPRPDPEPEPEPEPEPKPAPRPEPEPEPEPKPKPEPEPKPEPKPEPESEPASEEQITQAAGEDTEEPSEKATEAPAADRNSSQQVELNAGDSSEVDSYLARLGRHLSRFYEYPRRARRLGQEGSPVIIFEFDRTGALVRHSLGQSSDHSLLDSAALDMLKAAEPLPAVPESMKGESFTYALPVRFSLR